MPRQTRRPLILCLLISLPVVCASARANTALADTPPAPAQPPPTTNASYIDAEGTAHVTRIVPVPQTVSSEAQKRLARPMNDANRPESLQERRRKTDLWQNATGKQFQQLYPVTIAEQTMAGVPIRVITPASLPDESRDRILLNLHGGGFNSDSGSWTESIPVAALSKIKTIAVLYRLAPENPFPAGVNDAIAVYKELLKTYQPSKIAIFGTSAGAILTAEVAVQLQQSGLPLPAALGIFSGLGDFSHVADSTALFSLNGLSGYLPTPTSKTSPDTAYIGKTSPTDPVLSPLFADLTKLPPTLFITSTRDLLLSGTTILHRAFLRAGVDARLVVFEALPHAFWNDPDLPESKEAHQIMASFFASQLAK